MNNHYELKSVFNLKEEILDFATPSNTKWIHKNGFDILSLPLYILKNNPELIKLCDKFKAYPIVLKMQPNTFYRLHIDANRAAAINVLLDGEDSLTFYASDTLDEEVSTIDVLKYNKNKMYLLDTKQKHGVINLNNQRIVFSLSFDHPLTYEQVKTFCIENNL